jgi:ABC-2 type transport system permease protein
MKNPTGIALSGPGHGLDDYTFGAMMTNEMLGFLAIFVALMSVLLFVRHTRAEEETGRAELVRASVVGRHAQPTAALVVVGGANIVLGGLIAIGLGGSGVEGITWKGSLLFGAALTGVGLVFTAIAAVTAQVTEHARGASGLAGALIGVAYALRAAGDLSNGALSWLSPIGWTQATSAYVDDRWWPLLPPLALSAALVYVAFAVTSRRDVGAGLIRPRPGPQTASRFLTTPLGLALRLQRASLIWWSTAMLLFGLMYGTLISDVEETLAENEALQEWIARIPGSDPTESFLAVIISMLAMVCSIYAIIAAQRPRSEETTGRAEPVLATAVSRTRWLSSHLTVSALGGTGLLLLSALGLGTTAAITADDSRLLPKVLGAALAYTPALWVSTASAIALFGLLPRAISLAWAVLVYGLTIGMLGGLLKFPDWMLNLSPFEHIPQLPAAELRPLPLILLTVIALGLITLGLAGFRRRDLQSN